MSKTHFLLLVLPLVIALLDQTRQDINNLAAEVPIRISSGVYRLRGKDLSKGTNKLASGNTRVLADGNGNFMHRTPLFSWIFNKKGG